MNFPAGLDARRTIMVVSTEMYRFTNL